MRQWLNLWLPFGYHRVLNARYLEAWHHHDQAYGKYGIKVPKGDGTFTYIQRKYADQVLRRELRNKGACLVFQYAAYAAVRLFGWMHWRHIKVDKR